MKKAKTASAQEVDAPHTSGREDRVPLNQLAFAHEYVMNFGNGAQAAIKAGYSSNYGSAKVQASRLLKNPKVVELIDSIRGDLAKRFDITEERIINELAMVVLFNFKDLIAPDGKSFVTGDDLERCTASAIETITFKNDRNGFSTTVTVYSKLAAIDQLVTYLGLFEDRGESRGADRKKALIAEAMERIRNRFRSTDNQEIEGSHTMGPPHVG